MHSGRLKDHDDVNEPLDTVCSWTLLQYIHISSTVMSCGLLGLLNSNGCDQLIYLINLLNPQYLPPQLVPTVLLILAFPLSFYSHWTK